MINGEDGAGPEADGALFLGFYADHEARIVHKIDHRQVKGVAEVDEADQFVGPLGGDGAAEEVGSWPKTPTGRPDNRARPMTTDRPWLAPISKKDPWSRTSARRRRTG